MTAGRRRRTDREMAGLSQIPVLAQVWMDAWIAKDRIALEAFLAPDYALVGAAFAGAR